MAESKGIRAGRAFVELFADGTKLTAGLKAAGAKLKAWGASITAVGARMSALGAAVVTPLAAMAIAAARGGGELYDLARRTGMSVEGLSALSHAASMSGNDMGELESAIYRMQKSIAGVADTAEGTTGSLAHLGLAAGDLLGKRPDEQFAIIAARIAAIQDPTRRAAAAMQVFGRSGARLLPLFEDFSKSAAQAKAFGFIKDPKAVAEAKAMENALTFLSQSFKSLTGALGGALMPYLRELFSGAAKIVLGVRDWARQNGDLILSVFKWGIALAGAGLAVVVLGKAIAMAGTVLGAVSTVIGGVGSAFSILGSVIGFLLSPIGLVIGAMAGLAGYFLVSSGAAGGALDWLSARFGELKDDALEAWGGISDALAAGDIGLAAKIVWLTLKMEWTKGTNALSQAWNGALTWFEQQMATVMYGGLTIAEYAWHGLEVAWIETTDFLSKTWTDFTAGIKTAWDWCGKSLEESWNKIKGVFSDFDAEAANTAVEQRYQDAQKQLWDAAKKEKAKREAKRQQEEAAEGQRHNQRLAQIGSESRSTEDALNKDYDDKMKANGDDLAAAKKEWHDALDAAHAKAKAKEKERGGPNGPGKLETPEELLAKLKGAAPGVNDALGQAAKISNVGTFNASAAWGLGAGGAVMNRIANATERTARNTAGEKGIVTLATE